MTKKVQNVTYNENYEMLKNIFFSSILFSIHGNFKKVYISETNEIDQEWEK